jgi:hypothetical protein
MNNIINSNQTVSQINGLMIQLQQTQHQLKLGIAVFNHTACAAKLH